MRLDNEIRGVICNYKKNLRGWRKGRRRRRGGEWRARYIGAYKEGD